MRQVGQLTSLLFFLGSSVAVAEDQGVPAILRSLPCVKRVDVVGSDSPDQTIVHLRDWHFLTRKVFDADLRSASGENFTETKLDELYESFLQEVERVQAEQTVILRRLIRDHALRQVSVEGITERDMPILVAKIGVMKKLEAQLPKYRHDLAEAQRRLVVSEKARQTETDDYRLSQEKVELIESLLVRHRLDLIRIGAAGQLLLASELDELVSLENEEAFLEANPMGKDGTVTFDSEADERREDAQIKNLLAGDRLTVVMLGGSHDLSDNIARLADGKCRYVSVTTRGFDAATEAGK